MELHSAIAPHLRTKRTLPTKTPPNYEPPFPAYSARFGDKVKDLVMAIFGVQGRGLSSSAVSPILHFVSTPDANAPRHHDFASVLDTSGYTNVTVICYWDSVPSYREWLRSSGFDTWWAGLDPQSEQHGWFREVFLPSASRFETVFSDNSVPEGAAHMRETVSSPISEHVYWGSARDRLPIAQNDAVAGEEWKPPIDSQRQASDSAGRGESAKTHTKNRRIRIPGRRNLCVIRSGQDWSNTLPRERELYLKTMHPVLTKGMNFLRDEGSAVGCISCRFMDVLPFSTASSLSDSARKRSSHSPSPTSPTPESDNKSSTDRTFGLAYFDSLASLEKWSREHSTHLEIFGGFLKYARELNNDVSLRLFHEILVLEEGMQDFEYVGCHANTGMLAAGGWL